MDHMASPICSLDICHNDWESNLGNNNNNDDNNNNNNNNNNNDNNNNIQLCSVHLILSGGKSGLKFLVCFPDTDEVQGRVCVSIYYYYDNIEAYITDVKCMFFIMKN